MGREQETRRVARLLEIIWLIQSAPRQWTRQRLADRFEVSVRSITNDVQVIRHRLRWDVRAERGSGYYFHGPVPRLPSVNYSVPEALALILAAQAGLNYGGAAQGGGKSPAMMLACSQCISGGLWKNGRPSMRGTSQSPDNSIQRLISAYRPSSGTESGRKAARVSRNSQIAISHSRVRGRTLGCATVERTV